MRFAKALMSSAVVVAAFTGTQAYAAAPTLSDVLGASGITFSGALDGSYDWSSNDAVLLRAFDTENDAWVFHQANLSASKTFDGGIGATINAILGDDANAVSGDGGSDDFDLTQAFISYTAGNFTAIGGRFVTLAGMEVINPSGNINASRSLLFYNQPLVHEGVRGTYKVSDALAFSLGLNNGQFATTKGIGGVNHDNNTNQTIEAQIALTPMPALSAFLTYYTGNEDPGAPGSDADIRVDTLDLVVNFNVTDSVYLGLNADYFNSEDGSGGHTEVKGVAGYAQVKFMPGWRAAVRSEYIEGEDGGGGISALRENTLTIAHAVTDNLEILAEGRHDRAVGDSAFGGNQIFFPIDNGPDNDQYTATLKAILKF